MVYVLIIVNTDKQKEICSILPLKTYVNVYVYLVCCLYSCHPAVYYIYSIFKHFGMIQLFLFSRLEFLEQLQVYSKVERESTENSHITSGLT